MGSVDNFSRNSIFSVYNKIEENEEIKIEGNDFEYHNFKIKKEVLDRNQSFRIIYSIIIISVMLKILGYHY